MCTRLSKHALSPHRRQSNDWQQLQLARTTWKDDRRRRDDMRAPLRPPSASASKDKACDRLRIWSSFSCCVNEINDNCKLNWSFLARIPFVALYVSNSCLARLIVVIVTIVIVAIAVVVVIIIVARTYSPCASWQVEFVVKQRIIQQQQQQQRQQWHTYC